MTLSIQLLPVRRKAAFPLSLVSAPSPQPLRSSPPFEAVDGGPLLRLLAAGTSAPTPCLGGARIDWVLNWGGARARSRAWGGVAGGRDWTPGDSKQFWTSSGEEPLGLRSSGRFLVGDQGWPGLYKVCILAHVCISICM